MIKTESLPDKIIREYHEVWCAIFFGGGRCTCKEEKNDIRDKD